jgi:nucleoside 2-deoxyribosyltransferase
MDRAADAGVGWRRDIRATLDDLNILWLDPTRKPIQIGIENDASRAHRKATKAQGNYSFVTKEMKPIRCVDLRMVDICDFLVVNLDLDIHACGTYEEIFLANRQKKPVFVHVEQGKNNTPDWLFAALPHEYFSSTWEQVHKHIKHVARDPKFVDYHNRWYFFDWMGVGDEQN